MDIAAGGPVAREISNVFDREDFFIVSFNLAPLSGDISAGAGLYVESLKRAFVC